MLTSLITKAPVAKIIYPFHPTEKGRKLKQENEKLLEQRENPNTCSVPENKPTKFLFNDNKNRKKVQTLMRKNFNRLSQVPVTTTIFLGLVAVLHYT